MPLEDFYPWSVVFVVVPVADEHGVIRNVPRGTGFLVSCSSETEPRYHHAYVVTASHVVSDGEPTKIRLKASVHGPGFVDVEVPEWVHHHTADVAIAPLRLAASADRPVTVTVEAERFVGSGDALGWEPELGERVYFMGLFDKFREMGERNIPMTRSGSVGALYVENVPIGPPEHVRYVTAHLIDCRSYAGFSGSPCFVQRDMFQRSSFLEDRQLVGDESGRVNTETALLGIVSGHFDMWGAARLTGDLPIEPGSVQVPLNTGVGVVTPAQAIKELMDMDELSQERKRIDEVRAGKRDDEGATLDRSETESEYDRFEDLARKLANTPKPKEDES